MRLRRSPSGPYEIPSFNFTSAASVSVSAANALPQTFAGVVPPNSPGGGNGVTGFRPVMVRRPTPTNLALVVTDARINGFDLDVAWGNWTAGALNSPQVNLQVFPFDLGYPRQGQSPSGPFIWRQRVVSVDDHVAIPADGAVVQTIANVIPRGDISVPIGVVPFVNAPEMATGIFIIDAGITDGGADNLDLLISWGNCTAAPVDSTEGDFLVTYCDPRAQVQRSPSQPAEIVEVEFNDAQAVATTPNETTDVTHVGVIPRGFLGWTVLQVVKPFQPAIWIAQSYLEDPGGGAPLDLVTRWLTTGAPDPTPSGAYKAVLARPI